MSRTRMVKNIMYPKVFTHPLTAASSVLVHEVLGCILHECAATQLPGNEDHEDYQRAGLVLGNSYQSVARKLCTMVLVHLHQV